MSIRRIWSCVALAALALGAATAPAAAAPMAPSTVSDVCGAGYAYVHAEPIVRFDSILPAGTVYVQYNAYTRSFCGFAVKSQWVGTATEMSVTTMGASGGVTQSNTVSGPRLYSIGPSRDAALESDGKDCVLFGAYILDPAGNQYAHQSANPAIGFTRLCV
jgi:hypothetical protein